MTVNGEEITSTPGHKFYAPEKGWTSAIDLRAGDILQLVNGEYVTVEAVQHEILEFPVKIYNFEVDGFHTYYVSEQSVLVHNNGCGLASDSENILGTEKYYNVDGSPIWPPNRGFDGSPKTTILEPGILVDRYGYDGGTFVSPLGTPYTERALPIGTDQKPYTVFEVIKPVEAQAGNIAPWFGEKGGGLQYEFNQSISDLIEQGVLQKVVK